MKKFQVNPVNKNINPTIIENSPHHIKNLNHVNIDSITAQPKGVFSERKKLIPRPMNMKFDNNYSIINTQSNMKK